MRSFLKKLHSNSAFNLLMFKLKLHPPTEIQNLLLFLMSSFYGSQCYLFYFIFMLFLVVKTLNRPQQERRNVLLKKNTKSTRKSFNEKHC